MRTTILPVTRDEIEPVGHAFFRREFALEHLGQPGRWLGSSGPLKSLSNPVQRGQFDACLSLRGFEFIREPSDPVAWRFIFESGTVSTTLWALGNKDARTKMESVHSASVKFALSRLEHLLADDLSTPRQRDLDGNLFATFQSGTDARRIPYLHTDAFLVNLNFDRMTSRYGTFSNTRVLSLAAQIEGIYADNIRFYRRSTLGHFDTTVCCAINKMDFDKSPIRLGVNSKLTQTSLDGDEIFLAWQKEGTRRGFGPKQAERILRYI